MVVNEYPCISLHTTSTTTYRWHIWEGVSSRKLSTSEVVAIDNKRTHRTFCAHGSRAHTHIQKREIERHTHHTCVCQWVGWNHLTCRGERERGAQKFFRSLSLSLIFEHDGLTNRFARVGVPPPSFVTWSLTSLPPSSFRLSFIGLFSSPCLVVTVLSSFFSILKFLVCVFFFAGNEFVLFVANSSIFVLFQESLNSIEVKTIPHTFTRNVWVEEIVVLKILSWLFAICRT